MYLKNIPTVVIPALSLYPLNYTKMLATWGTSGLKEHGSSLLENAKNVDFWRFFPFVLKERRQLGFSCCVATETATFRMTEHPPHSEEIKCQKLQKNSASCLHGRKVYVI